MIEKTGKKGGQINNKNAEKWTEQKAKKLGKSLIEWLKHDEKHICYEEFLIIEKGLYPSVLNYLGNKFESFSKLLDMAKKNTRD